LQNLWVHDNDIAGGAGLTAAIAAAGDNSYYESKNNRFEGNRYDLRASGSAPFFWSFGDQSEADWQTSGNDVSGTFQR
jgi:hypothetical protein